MYSQAFSAVGSPVGHISDIFFLCFFFWREGSWFVSESTSSPVGFYFWGNAVYYEPVRESL